MTLNSEPFGLQAFVELFVRSKASMGQKFQLRARDLVCTFLSLGFKNLRFDLFCVFSGLGEVNILDDSLS
jgi:hypothetical protein